MKKTRIHPKIPQPSSTEVEAMLLSWAPPSPPRELRDRIFRPITNDSTIQPSMVFGDWIRNHLSAWFAPAMACGLAACMLISGGSPRLNGNLWVSSAAASPWEDWEGYVAHTVASHSAANHCVAASFTWTNGSFAPSTNASATGGPSPL